MHPRDQTIFALSSGRPPTAIAIVRVSGARAGDVLDALAGRRPVARVATRATLRDGRGEAIDDAVVLWFPGPASATGEHVAEFHIHGGRAVLAALVARLAEFDDMRAAEPGEFTRRAFENGKIDLTEAEGLDDLIHADTDRQRRQALRQLKGLLGDRARDWRQRIIAASALVEAGIDFSDEGDVPAELLSPALAAIGELRKEIEETLAASARSERLRDGLVVAIAGAPNVGKSTLMNALARREVAIVSPHAGTTRDVIEVELDLEGYPVTLIDTAGIRDTDDPVEQEGVRRAKAKAAEADLVLWLVDSSGASLDALSTLEVPVWTVRNKADLAVEEPGRSGREIDAANPGQGGTKSGRLAASGDRSVGLAISAARGDGVSALLDRLALFAGQHFGGIEQAMIGRQRHRDLLRNTALSLQRSVDAAPRGEELVAEELRIAAACLGRLLGRVDVEDILDSIFRDFCIGK